MIFVIKMHLKSSCIKESDTNIIERINICSLNVIQSNQSHVFLQWKHEIKVHKERNVRHLAIYVHMSWFYKF